MDLELSADLKTAISAWLARAVQHLNNHSQQLAELKKCMEGDDDVCIVYSVRRNALVIETMDFSEQTYTEIFREELVPLAWRIGAPRNDVRINVSDLTSSERPDAN